ncbi:P-loop containing nucleoside triphosphate hydrolases superfamily protein [Wolffia australiana]
MEVTSVLRVAMGAVGDRCSLSDVSFPKIRLCHSSCRTNLRLASSGWMNTRLVFQNISLGLRGVAPKASSPVKAEVQVLEEGSMGKVYDALAAHLFDSITQLTDPNAKYLVGLAGPPGAGKSTVASEVINRLNKLWAQRFPNMEIDDIAAIIPMDGFHLYRSQLDAMEDPKEAHARRGAPWTFDPALLLKCLQNLRKQGSVYAPSFDHGVGDPVEEDIFVGHHHKVVIIEGNYLFLEDGAWREISSMFDEKWFIDIDLDLSMSRVVKRHMSTGKSPEVARRRVDYNDRPNAELIMESKKNADLVIKSVDWDG